MIDKIKDFKQESIRINGRLLATFHRDKKLLSFNGFEAIILNHSELEELTMWLIYIQDEMVK